MDRLFDVFNANKTKNREVIRFVPLELKINGHIKQINTAVINLNGIDMPLEYDQLVKYNPELNQNKGTTQFT